MTAVAHTKAALPGTAVTRRVVDALAGLYPGATTELAFRNPFELLVATILSAQSTDTRVNAVTPALFARFPEASALARAPQAEVERLIHSTGFFRSKARSLIAMAGALVERHRGEIPATMEDLVHLPGVGRKTANVVLGHALGVPGLPVDRHVLRVANRIGLAASDDPEVVEAQLCRRIPAARWTLASDLMILHGRRVCRPSPLCDRCPVTGDCAYFRRTHATPPPARRPSTREPAAGRRRASRTPSTRRGRTR